MSLWSFKASLRMWTVYVTGVSRFRRRAAGDLSEPPEEGEREGAEADRLPEGAGESWPGMSETEQSQGRSPGRARYTHLHTFTSLLSGLSLQERGGVQSLGRFSSPGLVVLYNVVAASQSSSLSWLPLCLFLLYFISLYMCFLYSYI